MTAPTEKTRLHNGTICSFDEQLRHSIQLAFAERVRPALSAIDVSVRDGNVLLGGEVNSYYRKQLAQVAAMSVPGVASVMNRMVVR